MSRHRCSAAQDVLLITAEDSTGTPLPAAPVIAALLPPGNLADVQIQMNGGRLTMYGLPLELVAKYGCRHSV